MREMGWSWSELEATPVYVRRFAWDFLMAQRRIANGAAAERSQDRPDGDQTTGGVRRVKR